MPVWVIDFLVLLVERCLPPTVLSDLGLGYTARAALKHPGLHSLIVVETLEAVIEWHRCGLVPLGPEQTGDPRCRFVCGDFFALAASPQLSFDPANQAGSPTPCCSTSTTVRAISCIPATGHTMNRPGCVLSANIFTRLAFRVLVR